MINSICTNFNGIRFGDRSLQKTTYKPLYTNESKSGTTAQSSFPGYYYPIKFGSTSVSPTPIQPSEAAMLKELFPNSLENVIIGQSNFGDCHFLASTQAFIDGLNDPETVQYFPGGREGYMCKMIKQLTEDKYKITFPHYPNDPVEVTKKEAIKGEDVCDSEGNTKHINPVKGDLGIKILERAAAKLKRKYTNPDPGHDLPCLQGGTDYVSLTAYTDRKADAGWIYSQKDLKKFTDIQGPYILTVDSKWSIGEKGKELGLKPQHNYAARVDNEHGAILLKDPHDTSKITTLDYDTFIQYFDRFAVIDFTKNPKPINS